MASYTRQSTFSDGDLITAALFNDEYNQLVAAFDNATGHKHDGTVGEGPVISVLGDSGLSTPLNKILIDTTNDHIEFYIDVSGTSTQQLYIADGAIVPATNDDVDLGTSASKFKDLYLSGTANITGNAVVTGNLTVEGTTVTLNTATLDVEDKNITLNYGTGDTSSNADGAGITIQDAVNASTDATILWNAANDRFDFSHAIDVTGTITSDRFTVDATGSLAPNSGNLELSSSNTGIIYDAQNGYHTFKNNGTNSLQINGGTNHVNIVLGDLELGGSTTITNNKTAYLKGVYVSDAQPTLRLTDTDATNQYTDFFMSASYALFQNRNNTANGGFIFRGNNGSVNTEYMRIDPSGNVLVGKTSASQDNTVGTEIKPTRIISVSDGVATLVLNRKTSDGSILNLKKDNVQVGTISTVAGYLGLASGDTGFLFRAAYDDILPYSSTANSAIDNTIDLGDPSFGFKDLYLSGTANFGSLSDGTITITGFVDEDNMSSNSATLLPTQQSVKAYVDSQVGSVDTLAEILLNGNTTSGTDIAVSTGDDITFADSSKAIFGTGSDLQIYSDGATGIIQQVGAGVLLLKGQDFYIQNDAGENFLRAETDGAVRLYYDNAGKLDTTSTGIDVTGNITASGTIDINSDSGQLQFGADNDMQIFHNGANGEINIATGSFTIDSPETITLNADQSGRVLLSDGTTNYGRFQKGGSSWNFHGLVQNNSFRFLGNDGGTETEVMRIQYDGNIGIGTSSPLGKLHIFNSEDNSSILTTLGTTVDESSIRIENDSTAVGSFASLFLRADTGDARIAAIKKSNTDNNVDIAFILDDASAADSKERLRIVGESGHVGIGTSNPSYLLHIDNVGGGDGIALQDTNDAGSTGLHFLNNSGTIVAEVSGLSDNTGMTFETAGSERMRIDSSGKVGIGTTSPDATLKVVSSSATTLGSWVRADNYGLRVSAGSTSSHYALRIANSSDATLATFNGDGKVGIGTSSPAATLDIVAASTNAVKISRADGNAVELLIESQNGDNVVTFSDGGTDKWSIGKDNTDSSFRLAQGGILGVNDAIVVNSSRSVGIGTASPSTPIHVYNATVNNIATFESGDADARITIKDNTSTSYIINENGTLTFNADAVNQVGSSFMRFNVDNTERVRIDSSGNFLVGKTSATISTEGVILANQSYFTRSGGNTAFFNRTSSDGNVIAFGKDGTTVGSIGVDNSDNLVIEGNSTHSGFQFGTDTILPHKNGALISSTINLGNNAYKFKDLHLSGTAYVENLEVSGTTTTINTANLNVEDNNITINYSTGDSSTTADGAGITIQDAVNSTTDATILWNATNDEFDFSHGLDVTGTVTSDGFTVEGDATIKGGSDVSNTGATLQLESTETQAVGSGASISFKGDDGSGTQRVFGVIKGSKTSATSGNFNGGLDFFTRVTAEANARKRLAIASNGDISFYEDTGTTQALFWDSSAESLGIGTTSPVSVLDLSSGNSAGDGLSFGSTSTEIRRGNSGSNLQMAHWGNVSMIIDSDGNDTNRFFNIMHNTNESSSATELFRVQENGNIGIGTSSPNSKLTVSDVTSPVLELNRNGSIGNGWIKSTDSSNNEEAAIQMYNGEFRFYNNGSQNVTITSGGSVGIGTSSPDALLHLSANTGATLRLESTDTAIAANEVMGAIEWEGNDATTGSSGIAGKIDVITEDATPEYSMRFFTQDNLSGTYELAERMRIKSDGNVGIGTTAPDRKLTVSGTLGIGIDDYIVHNGDSNSFFGFNGLDSFKVRTGGGDRLVIGNDDSNFNTNLGIGTSSPSAKLDIVGSKDSTNLIVSAALNTVGGGSLADYNEILFDNSHVSGASGQAYIRHLANSHNDSESAIAIGTTTTGGTTAEALRIRGSGNVGIGETAPSDLLHINKNQNAGTQIQIENQNTGASSYAGLNFNGQGNNLTIKNWGDGTSKANATEFISTASGSHFIFSTQSTERVRIDSSGNLLVGTSSTAPYASTSNTASGISLRGEWGLIGASRVDNYSLSLNRANSDGDIVNFRKSGATVGSISAAAGTIRVNGTDGSGLYFANASVFPSADNVKDLGASSNRYKDLHLSGTANVGLLEVYHATTDTVANFESGDNSVAVNFTAADNSMQIATSGTDGIIKNNGAGSFRLFNNGSERARIDSSGNLLVGQTSQSPNTVGISLNNNGNISAKRDGGIVALFNRATSDGEIISIRKDDVTVGEIGTNSGYVRIGTGDTHLLYHSGIDTIIPYSGSANRDDAISLGYSGARFKDLHLSGTGYFGTRVGIKNTSPSSQFFNTLVVGDTSGDNGITIQSSATGRGVLAFSDTDAATSGRYDGFINYNHTSQYMSFHTNTGNEHMRIDNVGNLLIGQTTGNVYNQSSVSGFKLDGASGNLQIARSSGTTAFFNRMSSNGIIVDFRKDGSQVGVIGSYVDLLYIGRGDTTLIFDDANDHIVPRGSGGGTRDNVINLGSSSNRFNDLHLGGTVNGNKIHLVNNATDDTVLLESTEDSSSAAPVLTFKRNSSSVADADYLGQLKFKGENNADQEVVYAKITAKISDASDGTEDGIIEFANKKAGSNVITARLTSETFKLLNGTDLEVNGSITADGNITAYSDKRLKDNIETLNGSKVLDMRGVSYVKDGKKGSGVIAQEIEKIAPELVHTAKDEMGTKSVAYGNLVGYLIEAIKDQQEQINELKGKLNDITG